MTPPSSSRTATRRTSPCTCSRARGRKSRPSSSAASMPSSISIRKFSLFRGPVEHPATARTQELAAAQPGKEGRLRSTPPAVAPAFYGSAPAPRTAQTLPPGSVPVQARLAAQSPPPELVPAQDPRAAQAPPRGLAPVQERRAAQSPPLGLVPVQVPRAAQSPPRELEPVQHPCAAQAQSPVRVQAPELSPAPAPAARPASAVPAHPQKPPYPTPAAAPPAAAPAGYPAHSRYTAAQSAEPLP